MYSYTYTRPIGVFARMMKESENNSTYEEKVARNPSNRSSLVFDHYTVCKGREWVDKEMPRGKRIEPILPPSAVRRTPHRI